MNSSTFRIGTYNILKPLNKFSWIVPTLPRYTHIIECLIPNLDPTILGLNEVSLMFYSLLLKDEYINSTYHISKLHNNRSTLNSIIISKHPMIILHQRTRQLIVLIKKHDKPIIVCNFHLQALEKNYENRRKQLNDLENLLEQMSRDYASILKSRPDQELLKQAFKDKSIFLLGDLNLHMTGETRFLSDIAFRDLWLEKKKDDKEYTWDPQRNKMINWFLVFDNRRMRLDRICVKQNSKIKVDDIFLFGDKKIGKCYLFPSDHFGIAADVRFVNTKVNMDYSRLLGMDNFFSTGYRSMKRIICMRYIAVIFGISLILGLAIGLPIYFSTKE